MRASLNGKETQNLAVAYPGDTVALSFALPEDAELLKRVGVKLQIKPLARGIGSLWCSYHGYPYADARPNLCASGPALETCAWDDSTHRFRRTLCGSAITAHCCKGRAPKSEHPSPKLPSTDCTVT